MKQRFTTRNTHVYPDRIDLRLVDGPFSSLGPLGIPAAGGRRLQGAVHHGIRVLEPGAGMVGPVFNRIATSFIDSFHPRAAKYGE